MQRLYPVERKKKPKEFMGQQKDWSYYNLQWSWKLCWGLFKLKCITVGKSYIAVMCYSSTCSTLREIDSEVCKGTAVKAALWPWIYCKSQPFGTFLQHQKCLLELLTPFYRISFKVKSFLLKLLLQVHNITGTRPIDRSLCLQLL